MLKVCTGLTKTLSIPDDDYLREGRRGKGGRDGDGERERGREGDR